jgi:hypothetical protein
MKVHFFWCVIYETFEKAIRNMTKFLYQIICVRLIFKSHIFVDLKETFYETRCIFNQFGSERYSCLQNFLWKLGFQYKGGNIDHNWIVLKNENAVIGLFQGMFKDNIITFNPGWDGNAHNLEEYDDIRLIQETLKKARIELTREADSATEGPEYITLTDPDGNNILIDQHR